MWTTYPSISIFRAYAEKFRVCSSAIFCRISSRSSGVTGTRRTIFRVRFVMVSPRFLGVWGTPQQAFLPGVATLPMLATLPLPTTKTPQHPRFARKMQKKEDAFCILSMTVRGNQTHTGSFYCSWIRRAPSMAPSTMGKYSSGQSCSLWLTR